MSGLHITSDETPATDDTAAPENSRAALADELRARLAELKARHAAEARARGREREASRPVVPTGVAGLDLRLGGGLRPGLVHEIWSPDQGARGAAAGFALALAAALDQADPSRPFGAGDLFWVWPKRLAQETGLPYGPGLMAFGHDPGRILLVEPGSGLDVLWAVEEALAATPLAAVLAVVDEAYVSRAFTASRRMALAARKHGTSAFLLGAGPGTLASAAPLRWLVGPLPSPPAAGERNIAGRIPLFAAAPRWRVSLVRNRFGETGAFELAWNPEAGVLAEAGDAAQARAPAGERSRRFG